MLNTHEDKIKSLSSLSAKSEDQKTKHQKHNDRLSLKYKQRIVNYFMKEMSETPIMLQDDYSMKKNMNYEDQKLKKKRYSIATSKQDFEKGIL